MEIPTETVKTVGNNGGEASTNDVNSIEETVYENLSGPVEGHNPTKEGIEEENGNDDRDFGIELEDLTLVGENITDELSSGSVQSSLENDGTAVGTTLISSGGFQDGSSGKDDIFLVDFDFIVDIVFGLVRVQ